MRKPAFVIVLTLMILSTMPILHVQIAHASTSTIDLAINEGIQYIIRSLAFLDNSYSRAVIRDHPSIPITLIWNNRVFMAGGFLDPGVRDYYHEIVSVEENRISVRYFFNLDADWDYDVVILVNVTNIDQNRDFVAIRVERCDMSNVKMYVGSYPRVINGEVIYANYSKWWIEYYTYTSHYSNRYVARHSTRIAAWLLEELGYYEFSSALHAFMNELGFTYDVYAPVFGRSNSYPDDFFDKAVESWLGAGYNAHPWIFTNSVSLYPYKSRMYIFSEIGATEIAIRGWKEAPLYKLLMAMHLLNKYGSSRASDARTLIGQALYEGGWDGYGLSKARLELDYILYGDRTICERTPLVDQILAIGGVIVPLQPGCAYTYNYKGYPIYLNSVLLATLVRYYLVTGQTVITYNNRSYNILEIMDRLAGILIKTQWIYEQSTHWGNLRLAMFRGGWPAAYDVVGAQLVVKPSAWGIIDTITNGVDETIGMVFGVGFALKERLKGLGINPVVDFSSREAVRGILPMPGEYPSIVNSESTILAVQALRLYRQLMRVPIQPPVRILPQGMFISAGGYGGAYSGGWTALEGHLVFAYAQYPGAGAGWWYQYSRFNITLPSTGDYTVIVRGLAKYALYAYNGYSEVNVTVRVYDNDWNIIGTQSIRLANLTSNNAYRVLENETPIYIALNITTATRSVIVEVGARPMSIASACADIGHMYGDYDHYLYIESVFVVPRGEI